MKKFIYKVRFNEGKAIVDCLNANFSQVQHEADGTYIFTDTVRTNKRSTEASIKTYFCKYLNQFEPLKKNYVIISMEEAALN